MSEYTRPATWDDVKRLAALLNDAGVEYALVGGYALAAHGFNRFTGLACRLEGFSIVLVVWP